MRKISKKLAGFALFVSLMMAFALIPAMAAPLNNDADLISVAGKSAANGAPSGSDIANAIVWNVSVDNSVSEIKKSDILVSSGASVNLYSDTAFSVEITGTDPLALFEGGYTTAYIKVTALDGITAKYYRVTIERPGSIDYKVNGTVFSWIDGINTVYLNSDNDVLDLLKTPNQAKKILVAAPDNSTVTIKGNLVELNNLSIEVANDITLKLDQVNMTSPNRVDTLRLLKSDTDYTTTMTLEVTGTNTLTSRGFGGGIHSSFDQKLIITGTGTLNVRGGTVTDSSGEGGKGIVMDGFGGSPDVPTAGPGATLTIQGGVTVNAYGGDSNSHSSGDGILIGYGDLYVLNGAIVNTFSGETTGTNYNAAAGVRTSFLASDHTKGGNIFVTNATLNGTGKGATQVSGAMGLYAAMSMNLTNATVEARGGNGPNQNGNTGIYVGEGDLVISGGQVITKGGNGGTNGSHGILVYKGTALINNGANVTSEGGNGVSGLGGTGLRTFGNGTGNTVTIAANAGSVYIRGGQGASAQRASIIAKEAYIATGNVGNILMEGSNPRTIKNTASGDEVYMVKVNSDPSGTFNYTASINGTLGGTYSYVSPGKANESAYMWIPVGNQTITAVDYLPKAIQLGAVDTTEITLTKVIQLTLDTKSPNSGTSLAGNQTNLVLTFSEPVTVVPGKHISIKRAADDSVVESIDLSSSQVVVNNKTVTVTLSSSLYYSTAYYVQIEGSAIKNADNTFYAGIADKTSWTFSTQLRSEVTADTSAELLYYLSNANVSKINLIAGKTYQYVGGTISRSLTIDGHGAKLVAGLGFTENIIRSDGTVFYGLSNFNNEKTFIGVSGSQGDLKLINVVIENGVNKNGTDTSSDGICAVFNVKPDASLSMDKVTLKGFHNNPVLGNKNAFGVHAEPGAKAVTVINSIFDSSNAFRNAVAIRGGDFSVENNTFEGTDFPEKLRQDDGYEYAIYIFGGTGKVELNSINGFDSAIQPGYTSAGIAVTAFYPTDVSITKNRLAQSVSGISVTAFWTGAGTNNVLKINNIPVIDLNNDYSTGKAFEHAFEIGEALGRANNQVPVTVMVDQNDEVSIGGGNFSVYGGYRSPGVSVKSLVNNTLTLELNGTIQSDKALAMMTGFEVQIDNSGTWTNFTDFTFRSASLVDLSLVSGHTYKFRLKMTHLSTPDSGDFLSRTLQTYSNEIAPPDKPTAVSASAGSSSAYVNFTAPLKNGGMNVTSYKVIVFEDGVEKVGITATGTVSPIRVTGLTNGKTYYFKVVAINGLGAGEISDQSNSVIPAQTPVSDNQGSSNSSNTTPTTPNAAVEVLVNGKVENAGTAKVDTTGNRVTTTITVDQAKIEQKLAIEGNGSVVTIPVNSKSDVVIGQLNGQMIKNMEAKTAVLEIRTEMATYHLPTEQINIASIAEKLGQNVALKDIVVKIELAKSTEKVIQAVQENAQKDGFTVVAPPVDFTITCTYNNQVAEVKNFNAYVERRIALPTGVDPNKITTGIVLDADGTVRHVPTKVSLVDGKYYAIINSLTNSPYSVVWNPMEFKDAAAHWAKTAINDMGSRMVVEGVSESVFNPNGDITRAEFATIIVKALGLAPDKANGAFKDVPSNSWHAGYIATASRYGIITGYNSSTFGPNDKITREQAMTMITKAMKITGLYKEPSNEVIEKALAQFKDTEMVSNYAKMSAASCITNDIVSGKDGKMLAPKAYMTRAEVAVMIRNLLLKSNLI